MLIVDNDVPAEKMFSLRLTLPSIFHEPLREMAAQADRSMASLARVVLVDAIRRAIAARK
jgi:hypothetical protein